MCRCGSSGRHLLRSTRAPSCAMSSRVDCGGRRRLEPQRRVDRRPPLQAQGSLVDEHSVVQPRRLALSASERFGHPHEIVPLGFGDEAREREQFAALLAREAREMSAVRLDCPKDANAGLDVIVRKCGFRERPWIRRFHGAHCNAGGRVARLG